MEKLKERKQAIISLFLLTGITPDILKNEPLVHLNLEDSFFLKRDVDKKNYRKVKGWKEWNGKVNCQLTFQ